MNPIKFISFILFLGISLAGCETLLEPSRDNQHTYDRILKDPAFAEGLLTNGYVSMPSSYLFEDVATDDAVSNDNFNSYRRMATGELSAIFNPMSIWASSYGAIFNLNYFLTVVNDVEWSWQSSARNDYFKQKHTAEAYALRAYHYQRLLKYFAGKDAGGTLLGVPLVTTPLGADDNWRVPRATFQATVDQINADYNRALAVLPYKYANDPGNLEWTRVFGEQNTNRIQGQIIKALQVQLGLLEASPLYNDGSYNQTKCVATAQKAAELLDEINGPDGLPTNGVVFYATDADAVSNREIFWRRDYFTSNSMESDNFPPSSFGLGRVNPSQNLVDAFPDADGYPIDQSSTYDANDPYNNRDPRLKKAILTHGASYKGVVLNMDPNNPVNNDGLNKLAGRSTRTGYYLAKLLRSDASVNPTSPATRRHFFPYIRYTELFLIYAEMANEAWGPDADGGLGYTARDVIEAIRKRAGIKQPDNYLASITTQEEMRDLIRNERRLELCFEGHRFWDLRRWMLNLNETVRGINVNAGTNTFTKINVETRNYPQGVYSLPIPQQEILKYSELKQNSGW